MPDLLNMKEQVLDEGVARKFLLGQLPAEEQGQIEELAFTDVDTFAFLESMEDELIDDFIQGELSNSEEERFKDHFLPKGGRRLNLQVSQVLQQHLDRTAPKPAPVQKFSFLDWFKRQNTLLQWGMSAAGLALLLIAVWLLMLAYNAQKATQLEAGPTKPVVIPTPELKSYPTVEPTPPPAHAENSPENGPRRPSPEKKTSPVSFAVTLFASGAPRGTGAQPFNLPANVSRVPVRLVFHSDNKIPTCEATLENDAGTIHSWSSLKPAPYGGAQKVELEMPASLLTPQESYTIILTRISSTGEKVVFARFPFQVIK